MKKVLFVLVFSILLVGGCGKKYLLPPSRPKLKIYGGFASDTVVDVLSGDTCWFVSFPGEDFWGSGYYIRFYWGNGDSTTGVEVRWDSELEDYVAYVKYKWFLAGTTTINFNVTARAYTNWDRYAPSELSKPLVVRVHKDTLKK